jgi:hypothetical protein
MNALKAAAIGAAVAVVQVGNKGGRGFIIATRHARYVVTAAHCVFNKLPVPHPARFSNEVTYRNLIGPLGGKRRVWAECMFIDPIADIAVFGTPDTQNLWEQARAYEELTEQTPAFAIGKLSFPRRRFGFREASSEARILSLTGEWFNCRITGLGRSLWIEDAAQPIVGGMSGSPIILPDGSAVGIVCVSTEGENPAAAGPNPMLAANLPAWLLEEAAPGARKSGWTP